MKKRDSESQLTVPMPAGGSRFLLRRAQTQRVLRAAKRESHQYNADESYGDALRVPNASGTWRRDAHVAVSASTSALATRATSPAEKYSFGEFKSLKNLQSVVNAQLAASALAATSAGASTGTSLQATPRAVSTPGEAPIKTNETPRKRPRRFEDIVAVTMLVKNWLASAKEARLRAENASAASDARRQIHTSLVFEPLPIALEKAASLFGSSSAIFSTSPKSSRCVNAEFTTHEPENISALQSQFTTSLGQDSVKDLSNTKQIVKPWERNYQDSVSISSNHFANKPLETVNHIPTVPEANILTDFMIIPTAGASFFRKFCDTTRAAVKVMSMAKKKILDLPFQTVDPARSFYYYWTFIVYVGFLYNSLMCVIFVFDDTMSGTSHFFAIWLSLNAFFDSVNLFDILINSKLTQMEDGIMIHSWSVLCKRYFKSRNFLLDFFAVLPTDLLLFLAPQCSLLRINRLFKVHRVLDFIERTNMRTNYPNGFRICHIVIICVVLFHWNAALYYKISLLREDSCTNISTMDQMENFSCIKAWEFKYIKIEDPLFATCDILLTDDDERCGLNESGRDPDDRKFYVDQLADYWTNKFKPIFFSNFTKQYSLSIYWSSLTLTTSGQQPYPSEALHNLLEIFDTIAGVLVFAVIVGSVGNVVTTMNRDRAEIQQLMDGIKFYMNYRNVKMDIQRRVLDCVGYIQQHGMTQNEDSIMHSLPRRLQGELAVHLHMDTLRRVELLSECEANLLYELVLRLQSHMFAPNDFLTRCGDVTKEMFIVKSGKLESLSQCGEVLETFQEGCTFGELSILKMSWAERANRRVRSLRSIGYSEVYVLKQEDVLDVLRDYPDAKHNLVLKARELIHKRGKTRIEDAGEFLDESILDENAQQIIVATQNVDEKLENLSGVLNEIDGQLFQLITRFRENTDSMKRQMTKLEKTFNENRPKMKRNRLQILMKRLA